MSEAGGPEPAAANDSELALANWVAELVERLDAGESVDLDALAAAEPDRAAQLDRVLPAVKRMITFGKTLARTPIEASSPVGPTPPTALGTLGDFRLLREVGRGGMGVVYETLQISLGRRVALKILPLASALDSRRHQRFLIEARAAACLHHSHIVPVYAVGSERGVPYYAMQFIDGCTLAQVLEQLRVEDRADSPGSPTPIGGSDARMFVESFDRGPKQSRRPSTLGGSSRERGYVRAVAELGRRSAEALDHAHGRGVLHRDIKPGNLMLDGDGHLWITDFGLARIEGDGPLTLTGDIVGTLRYMSPEQALARRAALDGRSDVYSLAATLYELLALRPVFEGADRIEILGKIEREEPTRLRRLNPAVPRDLETIIHKCLAKEPGDRYATALDLAADLGRFLDVRPIAARPPGALELLGKWARRNRAVVAAAGLVVVLALGVLQGGLIWSNAWLARHNERLRIERDRAEELGARLKDQRDLAERRRRVADRHVYASRVRQAGEAVRAGKFARAQEILRDCLPAPGEDDGREFAWRRLWRESRKTLVVLSERSERITTLALSTDGRTLATGDRDGSIRLRDPETGEITKTLRASSASGVALLAVSPDGRMLASADEGDSAGGESARSAIHLWSLDTGRLASRFHEFDSIDSIDSIAFDARSEHLWVVSEPRPEPWRLERWEVRTDPARARRTWSRDWEAARTPRAGDGPIAAIEGPGSGFRLRDLAEATSLGWRGRVWHVLGQVTAGSAEGGLLAVGAGPWNVVWDVAADRELTRFPSTQLRGLAGMSFGPSGRLLAVEFNHVDRCDVHDLGTGEVRAISSGFRDPDSNGSTVFSADGRHLARSVSRPGATRVSVWALDSGREAAVYPEKGEGATTLGFAKGGESLIFEWNSAAVLWRIRPTPDPPDPVGHSDEAWAVAYSGDGRLIATGSDDADPRTILIREAATGQVLRGWKAHDTTTSALAFQPGSTIVASAGLKSEGNLRLWEADTGKLVATLDGHKDKVRAVAFSPDGRTLASAGSDRVVRLWDVADRRLLRTLEGHSEAVRQVAFSPDGRTLASVGNDRTIRLWAWEGGDSLWTSRVDAKVAAVAFSPRGEIIAWAQEDGIVQRREVSGGKLLPPAHTEYDELRCLAVSPDGRTIAAAGKSGRIHLLEPCSGQELLVIDGPAGQVNSLAFSPDGSDLAACWHDGTVRILRGRQE